MRGIKDYKLVIKAPGSFPRLSPAFANNSGGFQSKEGKGGAPFLSSALRNERPEMSGAKPTNCYSDEQSHKKSREVCNWKSGRNTKERARAQNDTGIVRLVLLQGYL